QAQSPNAPSATLYQTDHAAGQLGLRLIQIPSSAAAMHIVPDTPSNHGSSVFMYALPMLAPSRLPAIPPRPAGRGPPLGARGPGGEDSSSPLVHDHWRAHLHPIVVRGNVRQREVDAAVRAVVERGGIIVRQVGAHAELDAPPGIVQVVADELVP